MFRRSVNASLDLSSRGSGSRQVPDSRIKRSRTARCDHALHTI